VEEGGGVNRIRNTHSVLKSIYKCSIVFISPGVFVQTGRRLACQQKDLFV